MTAKPEYGYGQDMTASGATWSLTGKEASGTFGLKFSVDEYADPVEMQGGALLSRNLADEVDWEMTNHVPQRTQLEHLRVRPKANSPLKTLKIPAELGFVHRGGISQSDMAARPGYGKSLDLIDGKYEWDVWGEANSGKFALSVSLDDGKSSLETNDFLLVSDKLDDEAELVINGKLVSGEDLLLPLGKKVEAILRPKPGSPVTGFKAWFNYFDVEVPSKPAKTIRQELTASGATWELTIPARSTRLKMGFYLEGIDKGIEDTQYFVLPERLEDALEITRDTRILKPKQTVSQYFKVKCPVGSPLAGEKIHIESQHTGYFPKATFSPPDLEGVDLVEGTTLGWDVIAPDEDRSSAHPVVFNNRLYDSPASVGTIMTLSGVMSNDLGLYLNGLQLIFYKQRVKEYETSKIELKGIDGLLAVGAEVKVWLSRQSNVGIRGFDRPDVHTCFLTVNITDRTKLGYVDVAFAIYMGGELVYEYPSAIEFTVDVR
ncbi:hypothetical protein [Pseudomonas sp. TWI628]|uniref:hypothetical protein n=1 Tax=Pseudomonas sp. TWI628 TaxID=3136788 RepID=UPI0032092F28